MNMDLETLRGKLCKISNLSFCDFEVGLQLYFCCELGCLKVECHFGVNVCNFRSKHHKRDNALDKATSAKNLRKISVNTLFWDNRRSACNGRIHIH